MKAVIGLFDKPEDVENLLTELRRIGYGGESVSVVMQDPREQERALGADGKDPLETEAMTYGGAAVGGVLGMIAGLGALGALAIPGIGPIIAVGTIGGALASTAVGAGVGAAAGGLIGALTTEGVPEDDARAYAEGVRRGGALVTVRAENESAHEVAALMQQHNAADISRRRLEWDGREESTSGDPEAITLPGGLTPREDRTGRFAETPEERLQIKADHYGQQGHYDSAGRLMADDRTFESGETRVSDADRHELDVLNKTMRETGPRASRKMDIGDARYGSDGTPFVDPVERAEFERDRIAAPAPGLVAGAVTGAALGPVGAAGGAAGAHSAQEQDAAALGEARPDDGRPADPEHGSASTPVR